MRRLIAATALAIVAALQLGGSAPAQQTYPTRTVRLILPFAASATDITARLLADR